MLVGVGHDQAGIDREAFATDQTCRDARAGNTLNTWRKSVAEAFFAGARERRVVLDAELAEMGWAGGRRLRQLAVHLMLQEMLQDQRQGRRGDLLGPPARLREPDTDSEPRCALLHDVLQHKDGPIVLDLPPGDANGSFNGNIVTVWQMPLEDAGLLGYDKGAGGKYLILPPGYAGPKPDGYIPLQSDTFGGYALIRSNLVSHSEADVAKSVAYGKRIKVYPLSQAANPARDRLHRREGRHFRLHDPLRRQLLRASRPDRAERAMARARPRDDRPAQVARHREGQAVQARRGDARRMLDVCCARSAGLAGGEVRRRACRRSSRREAVGRFRRRPTSSRRRRKATPTPTPIPTDSRGLAYSYAFIGIKRLGAGQFYLISIRDKDGDAFDGGKTYRLTVPPNAPVEQYWSVTAYDRQTHALIQQHAARQPLLADPRDAEERRRLGRRLLRPEGAGGQGEQLGADRPGPQVRADVPRSTRRPRRCSTRRGCCRTSRRPRPAPKFKPVPIDNPRRFKLIQSRSRTSSAPSPTFISAQSH